MYPVAAAAAAVCLPAPAKDDWLTGPHRCAARRPPTGCFRCVFSADI